MADASPAPGVPQTSDKAYIGAGIAAVGTFLALWFFDNGEFTKDELMESIGTALLLSGLTGGGVHLKKNKRKA